MKYLDEIRPQFEKGGTVNSKVYKSKYTGQIFKNQNDAIAYNKQWLLVNKIPEYIGGDTNEARKKYWKQYPKVYAAVDSIANAYNINPALLRTRLSREGFVDSQIKRLNDAYFRKERINSYEDNLLRAPFATHGVKHFGLDDTHDNIQLGLVKPINENYHDVDFVNEFGRTTHGAQGNTTLDNIGLTAAELVYRRNTAAKDFPNASNKDLDRYAQVYFNMGNSGGRKWIIANPKSNKYSLIY